MEHLRGLSPSRLEEAEAIEDVCQVLEGAGLISVKRHKVYKTVQKTFGNRGTICIGMGVLESRKGPSLCFRKGFMVERVFTMSAIAPPVFDAEAFLHSAGLGRSCVEIRSKERFFSQGDIADCVFFLQKGRAKITVVSKEGKEATITMLSARDFVGEESLASVGAQRLTSATAITTCTALRIDRDEMIRAMHGENLFLDLFVKFLLARSMRTQADLVDQLFNSSERRLARVLLLMAEFGKPGEPESLIPKISQETLAEMIGTTRSRVSFFMNRFRKLGFIEYNGRIRVNKSLLNVILHDHFPNDNAAPPTIPSVPLNRSIRKITAQLV
jgi:CRP-like cAMP-binding protein